MPQTYRDAMRQAELGILERALRRTSGNVAAAARLLELPLRTLSYRLHRLGIIPQAYRPVPQTHFPEVPNE